MTSLTEKHYLRAVLFSELNNARNSQRRSKRTAKRMPTLHSQPILRLGGRLKFDDLSAHHIIHATHDGLKWSDLISHENS